MTAAARRLRSWSTPVLVAIAYAVVMRLSLGFAVPGEAVTAFWPASGVLVAALVVFPVARWTAIAIAVTFGHLAANLIAGYAPVLSLGYAAANVLEGLLAASILRRIARGTPTLATLRDVTGLSFLAGAAGAALSATGSLALSPGGGATPLERWVLWFAAVLLGIVVVAPALVALHNDPPWRRRVVRWRTIEGGVALAILTAGSVALFFRSTDAEAVPLIYLPYPILVWLALRFRPYVAALATVILVAIAASGTVHGLGPLTHVGRDGPERWLWLQAYLGVMTLTTQLVAAVVEDRRRTTEALDRQQASYRLVAGNARDIIALNAPTGEIRFISPASFPVMGYAPEALVGRSIYDFLHPDDGDAARGAYQSLLLGDGRHAARYRVRHADGHWVWLEATYGLVPGPESAGEREVVTVARDITERHHLETDLLQAQKMESIGRLAGGVAHDFNNLLTAVLGYTELAAASLPEGHTAGEDLLQIRIAAERAAGVTRQLLGFARQLPISPRLVDLGELVREAVALLRPLIGSHITPRVEADDAIWTVRIDPSQAMQLLTNLVLNARDAMPNGGTLVLAVSNDAVGSGGEDGHDVPAGDWVRLTVTDTGEGMSESVRARIFEPFFTTKEAGKGTGLGLASAYGIVHQNQGHIWCESEEGRGSAFTVLLPRRFEEPDRAPTTGTAGAASTGGSETVLVAEDDDEVRTLAARTLRQGGYRVLEAPDGAVAAAIASAHDGTIHLVVTDLMMPGLRGERLAGELAASRPETRVLFTSGHTGRTVNPEYLGVAFGDFLLKPYTPSALLGAARALLDRR